MKFNSPLPQPLPKECAKAAKIFKSFVDGANNGLDGVIPRTVLENAKGFAIFTIFKAGFLFSARAGAGIVIARLDDGTWSAPSAIGTAGLGVGGQGGAEVTDFVIVLNSKSAVKSFMAAGSLSLGGNMSIAVGPLGRNGEALGSLNTSGKVAAMYSYSKTRGLFGGVSIEGTVIVERQDANAQAYNADVSAKRLLGGSIEPPPWAQPLIKTIESCTELPGNRNWIADSSPNAGYVFGGVSSPSIETPPAQLKKKKPEFPPASWGEAKPGGSYFSSEYDAGSHCTGTSNASSNAWQEGDATAKSSFETKFESDFIPEEKLRRHSRMMSSSMSMPSSSRKEDDLLLDSWESPSPQLSHGRPMSTSSKQFSSIYDSTSNPFSTIPESNSFASPTSTGPQRSMSIRSQTSNAPYIAPKPELSRPLMPGEGVARAIALYDFTAVESGDLSFSKGDVIIITEKSDSTDDWWTGKLDGRRGIFPANFVEVV